MNQDSLQTIKSINDNEKPNILEKAAYSLVGLLSSVAVVSLGFIAIIGASLALVYGIFSFFIPFTIIVLAIVLVSKKVGDASYNDVSTRKELKHKIRYVARRLCWSLYGLSAGILILTVVSFINGYEFAVFHISIFSSALIVTIGCKLLIDDNVRKEAEEVSSNESAQLPDSFFTDSQSSANTNLFLRIAIPVILLALATTTAIYAFSVFYPAY